MPTVDRFEDLEIWKLARELVRLVYGMTRKDKFSKDYGLKDQIQRSSVSVMNNTAEGFESRTVKRFIDYLGRAKGSAGETRSMLYVALDRTYITKDEFDIAYQICITVSKKIQRFIQYLEDYNSNNRIEDAMTEYEA